MNNSTYWMPVCYDASQEIGGIWQSHTHYGTAVADKREAWAEARRMCDECGGVGFTVDRCDPINASDVSRRTSSDEQSLRGDA